MYEKYLNTDLNIGAMAVKEERIPTNNNNNEADDNYRAEVIDEDLESQ